MADVERGERVSIIERTADTKSLPGSIRVDFVKKVYAILFYMLGITFTITTPFIFRSAETSVWLARNQWVPTLCSACMTGFYVFNMCMIGAMCMGNNGLYRAYMGMFQSFPGNMIFL